MPTHKSYHSYLIESLKDPIEAAAYLETFLEDGDVEYIVLALKNVAEAQQDLVKYPNSNELNLENYSRLFEAEELVGINTIATLLGQLGLKLSITVKDSQPA